ncbi:Zinc finger protein 358 [Chionoecetes opilio]|uniref:Zinc finger protein 358 n=1 Tax=Chionoecetes opilio TaxID=41210 RepID=A0A8J4Y3X7_CHIOP|nr:Zinc finger protein 358 [Chionoecetes opilio]
MMTALDTNARLSCTEHSAMLANSLYHLYSQAALLDVRLVCDEVHIYAHKAVLAAGSKFFQERLESLGSGMVELHMSSANLGVLISPTELRALVEYLYCGELLVPRHRLSSMVALGRSLQVLGFLTDTQSYLAAPDAQYLTEMNYIALEPPGVMEIPAPQCTRLQAPTEETCGDLMGGGGSVGGPGVSLPLVSLKPHDPTLLQDPPKYSEPLKIDTNLNILGPTSNISFSELCTAPGLDGDALTTPCAQHMKHNTIPSVFESSVLEEAPNLKGKYHPQEAWEAYGKPDRDVVYSGTVNLREEAEATEDDGRLVGGARDHYHLHHHHHGQPPLPLPFPAVSRPLPDLQQMNPCLVEGEADDPSSTVMFLETLWADASSPSGVDLDNILRPDEMKVVGERWLRARRPSRVRLKVKDSIGGVSLQDTSQRMSAGASAAAAAAAPTSSTLPAVSPEEQTSGQDSKESWMVVLPDTRPHVHPHLADPSTLLQPPPPQPPPPDTLTQPPVDTPPFHIQSPVGQSFFSQGTAAGTVPLITSPMPLGASLMAQSSCPNAMPVASTSSLFGQSSLPTTPLLTQSNISITPYLQPSVLSTAVMNTELSHLQHPLSAMPLQAVSMQPLEPEVPLHYPPAVTFPQPTTSVFTQPSLSLSLPHHLIHHHHHHNTAASPPPHTITLPHTMSLPHTHTPPPSTTTHLPITLPPPSLLHHCSVSHASLSSSSSPSIAGEDILSQISSDSPPPLPHLPHPPSPHQASPTPPPFPTHLPISSPVTSWPNSPTTVSTTTSTTTTSTITTTMPDSPIPIPLSPQALKSHRSPPPSPSTSPPTSPPPSPPPHTPEPTNTPSRTPLLPPTSTTTIATTTTTAAAPLGPASPPDRSAGGEADHTCSQCSRSFRKMDKLTLHLWEEHEIGTVAKCQLCSFSSPLQSALVRHAETHTAALERRVCAVCGKTFKTRATLRTHLRNHRGEEAMHKCGFCAMMYSQKFNLIKHLASKHTRDPDGRPLTQPLPCPHCAFTSLADYKLKAHIIRRHTLNKPFKCDLCPYATTEKNALTKHTRTHTKERPYVCETCGFHAPTLSNLWRHRRSHTGEKPFECGQCGQQYADSKRLRDHMYKHNNVKPFMCHLCGYTCRRRDNLQTHVKKIHKLQDLNGSSVHHSVGFFTDSGILKRESNSDREECHIWNTSIDICS